MAHSPPVCRNAEGLGARQAMDAGLLEVRRKTDAAKALLARGLDPSPEAKTEKAQAALSNGNTFAPIPDREEMCQNLIDFPSAFQQRQIKRHCLILAPVD